MTTAGLIEALLFSRAEPWTTVELGAALDLDLEKIAAALDTLSESLTDRGLVLVRVQNTVTLGTHPEAHAVLEKIYKEELEKPLSKASIETLSIIMYGSEVTRGTIDYIRGVNSSFILRSLLVRGLIERKPYAKDRKRFAYAPSMALLGQLGVKSVSDLPDYEKIRAELAQAGSGAEVLEKNDTQEGEITGA